MHPHVLAQIDDLKAKLTTANDYIERLVMLVEEAEHNFHHKSHSLVCNGVHADNGMCEGDYLSYGFMEEVRDYIKSLKEK